MAFSYGKGNLKTAPKESKDAGIFKYYNNYLQGTDDDTKLLKHNFYAVMLHGWINITTPSSENNGNEPERWCAAKLSNEIGCVWREKGKNRPILLLSCFTGMAYAREIARRYLKLPVVAPRSTAIVGQNCNIYVKEEPEEERNYDKNVPYNVLNRLDWVMCFPNGEIKIIPGGATLNKKEAIKMVKTDWVYKK